MSTRPIVTRTVGVAGGATGGGRAAAVAGDVAARISGTAARGAGAIVGVEEGTAVAVGATIWVIWEISRMRSVIRSTSSVFVGVSAGAAGAGVGIFSSAGVIAARVARLGASEGRSAIGEGDGAEEIRVVAGGANVAAVIGAGGGTGVRAISMRGSSMIGAAGALGRAIDCGGGGATVSRVCSTKFVGAALFSKRDASRGCSVAVVGASERCRSVRRKLLMTRSSPGRAGGGSG